MLLDLQELSIGVHNTVLRSSWRATLPRVVKIRLEELFRSRKPRQRNSTLKDLSSLDGGLDSLAESVLPKRTVMTILEEHGLLTVDIQTREDPGHSHQEVISLLNTLRLSHTQPSIE